MFEIIFTVLAVWLLIKAIGWALKISWKALKAAAIIFIVLAVFSVIMCILL